MAPQPPYQPEAGTLSQASVDCALGSLGEGSCLTQLTAIQMANKQRLYSFYITSPKVKDSLLSPKAPYEITYQSSFPPPSWNPSSPLYL